MAEELHAAKCPAGGLSRRAGATLWIGLQSPVPRRGGMQKTDVERSHTKRQGTASAACEEGGQSDEPTRFCGAQRAEV